MGARYRVGVGLSYRTAIRSIRLAESIPELLESLSGYEMLSTPNAKKSIFLRLP
jgi:hypothetical protein